ncbi:hypothetical protein EVAR_84059_1 [Eumeta japonica]|uniref:Uncharacterized protein n=1 Tax=Eumeta variegata TaxID=151549 RepID=A0A4C1ZWX5_EUMVA|nr:hypothetical protein EVAR_84059_1 [Eumeta japonica]
MLKYVNAECRLVYYRPSKRGTEDGVRNDGGWAGDTWYRRGAPSKGGGPRSVRVCRSLKGKGQRPGHTANHVVDTVSELEKSEIIKYIKRCEAWRPAGQRTLDRQGREGRGAQRGGDLHRENTYEILLSESTGSGRAGASVRAEYPD